MLASEPLLVEKGSEYDLVIPCRCVPISNYAACQGGRLAVESVAALAWNGWQLSSGISGRLGLEYALNHF